MFERILIPLDGSPRAEMILTQVGRILRRGDSEVILLRVVDVDPNRFEQARRIAYETARGYERVEAHRYVHELAARLADRGIRVTERVAEGPAAATILEQAVEEHASLIAMTTHGRTGLSRWVLGSVAEKVVRAGPVPVLVLRSFHPTPLGDLQPATEEELPFRKILVPTDGSPAASAALSPAVKFAELFDSEVVVLHVERPVAVPGYPETAMPAVLPPTPSEEDLVTGQAAEWFSGAGQRIKRRTVVGSPGDEILDQSRAEEVDLIVMGTHGRSGFSRWLLGSVAERVLRHAGTPVLLVRGAGEETAEYPKARMETQKQAG